jgi:hypothetical protein
MQCSERRKIPPELTGNHLIKFMVRRLGWQSLRGKKLLDYGCGVRFARTIANLDLDIDLYAGVDVNAPAIEWLSAHLRPPKFRFVHLDLYHPRYNPNGRLRSVTGLPGLNGIGFDAVCMFSVVTHLAPDEAEMVCALVRSVSAPDAQLYVTALIDETLDGYREADQEHPRAKVIYGPETLAQVLQAAGWGTTHVYRPTKLVKWTFVARRHSAV